MRKLFGVLALAAAVYFLLPLYFGVLHIGMAVPSMALILLTVWCFWGKKFPKWLRRTLTVCYTVAIATVLLLLWQMEVVSHNLPIPENGDGTVIILGCKLDGNQPGLMLQNRIDAAYTYLTDHPDAVCVCSGGVDEGAVQADCIANALKAKGIAAERIYVERSSENTEENLRFSATIIKENNLSPVVMIATDHFHEYRAALHAQRNGLTPFSIACRSPWYFSGGYWCREMAAILATYFL